MKWHRFYVAGLAILFLACVSAAQDADKQALINIEQEYASPVPPAPGALTPAQKYMYDGPLMQLTAAGTVHTTSKAAILGGRGRGPSTTAPDPNVKRQTVRENFSVEIYGDTGLISYTQTITESGHQDTSLNKVDHQACLDTFVRRDGKWLGISNACSRSASPTP